MSQEVSFAALFLMGLMSSAHCVGMCGGIMASLSMTIPENKKKKIIAITFAYNFGRILSYCIIGGIVGLIVQFFADLSGADNSGLGSITFGLRVLAGLILIATGLYVSQWWLGLSKLEQIGSKLWLYIQPISKKFLPVTNIQRGFFLGCIWGWLPCGLVYAALAMAITQANALQSAKLMLAFGLGTLPTLIATGVISSMAIMPLKNWLQQKTLRVIVALAFICFGVWTIYAATQSGKHHHHGSETTPQVLDHSQHEHMHH